MPNITINIQNGGLGRQSANVDTWGGLFVEVAALPGGWTDNEVKRIFKTADVAEYGIIEDAASEDLKLAHWHISEAFRVAPNCTLYVQLSTIVADYDVINVAFKNKENRLRKFGYVFSTLLLSDAAVSGLHDSIDKLFTDFVQPARGVASFKKDAVDAIPDFSTKDYVRVMVDIANDFSTKVVNGSTVSGTAKTIFEGSLGMCGAAGTFLGQRLLLSVHQKSSWRSKPINSEGRWAILADINGASVETKTPTEITAYATEGVNLITRQLKLTDAFISNSRMACDTADDYAIINYGEVIDKASDLAYMGLVNELDRPIYADPTNGQITPDSIELLTEAAYNSINNNMVIGRTGDKVEVSVDLNTGSLPANAVYIDPSQNFLQTDTINVEIRIVPVGSAKEIVINIGLILPQ